MNRVVVVAGSGDGGGGVATDGGNAGRGSTSGSAICGDHGGSTPAAPLPVAPFPRWQNTLVSPPPGCTTLLLGGTCPCSATLWLRNPLVEPPSGIQQRLGPLGATRHLAPLAPHGATLSHLVPPVASSHQPVPLSTTRRLLESLGTTRRHQAPPDGDSGGGGGGGIGGGGGNAAGPA